MGTSAKHGGTDSDSSKDERRKGNELKMSPWSFTYDTRCFGDVIVESPSPKRQVFNVIDALGFTESYDATQNTVAGLEKTGRKFIQENCVSVSRGLAQSLSLSHQCVPSATRVAFR
jgi:hypothetical protein